MATITFSVNLQSSNRYTSRQPSDTQSERDNFSSTRITWFPDMLKDNRKLKHGDTFTISGANATYLKTNFTTGEFKFLDIVSEVAG